MSSSPLRLAFVSFFLFSLAALGCSAGGGKPVDAAVFDVPQDLWLGELPAGCPPGVANDIGVGKPCTPGGGQCDKNGSTPQCTCDSFLGLHAPPNTPCFCTSVGLGVCPAQNSCGKNATCCAYTTQGVAVGHLCVPEICLDGQICPAFLNQ